MFSTVSEISIVCARIDFPDISNFENSSLLKESLCTHSNSATSVTNSGNYTDRDEPLALRVDISTLSKPVKKFLYKDDCDVTPMCENQLEYFEEIEFFDRLWGTERIESPSVVTPKVDPSPAVSPWLDEPGCSTPKRTPVDTVNNHMENLTPSL